MRNIFDMDGGLMKILTYVENLFLLNIMTLLMCLPVITAGASLTAMHYVLFQIVEGTEGHVVKTFWKQFRINFKTSTPSWLILLAFALLLWFDYSLFSGVTGTGARIFTVFIVIGVFIAGGIALWLYPYLSRFIDTTRNALRNATALAFGYLPRTLGMMGITVLFVFLFTQITTLIPLFFVFGLTLPGHLSALLYTPVLKKLMEKAEDEH